MTILLNILCLIQGFIFIVLAGFHFYWLFGGKWGLHRVIPTKKDSKHASRIPAFATFLVAVILLSFSILYCHVSGFLSLSIIPKDITAYALWIIPSVFTLRAIGEFKYVGLFKKIKNTTFAKADTLFFTPLCLTLGIIGFLIAANFTR